MLLGDKGYLSQTIELDFDNEVLGGLLNGSVGGLLNGVVSNLLFGGHYFIIEGKDNAGAVVYSRSSNDGFAAGTGNGLTRIIQDRNGHYYVAITPDVSINRIRITEKLSGLLGLSTVKTMNGYHACYSTGSDACKQSFATFSESSGITLDLLGLGGAGVTDAQYAIEAYDGDTKVFSQRLNEQLIPGIDLLNLLSTWQMINIPFDPGKAFDRVAVGISSLVAANVISAPLEIYSIERFNTTTCIDPELQRDPKTTSPFNTPACVAHWLAFK